jgi:MFS-type transporter involved in bile tolerance (Atg22 family)
VSAPNPYAPPQAALKDAPPKAGSAIKAVTLGLLADIGGTAAVTIVFMMAYGIVLGASGAGVEEITAATDLTSTESWLFYATALLGLACSVLGGYVCARTARRNEMRLGAVLAILSAILGALLGGDQYQLGTLLSMTLASIGAVMVGARLGHAKNRGTK